jgi:hypothetical protein
VTRTPTPLRRHGVILTGFQHGRRSSPGRQHLRRCEERRVYVTSEAVRGLADLEAKERERCANFATKAIAAGLAERTVRVAEATRPADGGDGSDSTSRGRASAGAGSRLQGCVSSTSTGDHGV